MRMKLLAPWLANKHTELINGRKTHLRPPALDDYDEWQHLRRVSRQFLEPWEPEWDPIEFTRLSFRNRVRRQEQLAEEDSAFTYFIFDQNNELVGGITLSNVRRGIAQMASLGYWIGQPHIRKGYMKDAVLSLLPYAFSTLRLHRVEAACLPRNIASLALLRSCAFQEEGLARDYLKIAGKWEDHALFSKHQKP